VCLTIRSILFAILQFYSSTYSRFPRYSILALIYKPIWSLVYTTIVLHSYLSLPVFITRWLFSFLPTPFTVPPFYLSLLNPSQTFEDLFHIQILLKTKQTGRGRASQTNKQKKKQKQNGRGRASQTKTNKNITEKINNQVIEFLRSSSNVIAAEWYINSIINK
jgi:hypothetical protein